MVRPRPATPAALCDLPHVDPATVITPVRAHHATVSDEAEVGYWGTCPDCVTKSMPM